MASDLTRLPLRGQPGTFHVVVESPRGSTVKLKYEPELGAFTISRPLTRGLRYPFDWGFIPSTKGPDGDPLDAMVYWDVATWPGVVLPCRALGMLQVDQKKKKGRGRERNDRAEPAVAHPATPAHADRRSSSPSSRSGCRARASL